MKKLLLVLITFSISLGVDAQVYMRTHKNFGVYGQLNTSDFDKSGSYSFHAGVTRQMGRYILPELGYRRMVQRDNGRSVELENPIREHFITSAIIFRAPLIVINERKKGRSCRGEVLEIFCGPEVFYRFNETAGIRQNLSTSLKGGLGIFHVRTGHSKRSKAWTIKLEGYYRHQFENPMNEFHIPNEFGLQIRLLRYKVYDFVRN